MLPRREQIILNLIAVEESRIVRISSKIIKRALIEPEKCIDFVTTKILRDKFLTRYVDELLLQIKQ